MVYNVSSVGPSSERKPDEGQMLETLDYTIRLGSTPIFLYFDLYIHILYNKRSVLRRQSRDTNRNIKRFGCTADIRILYILYMCFTFKQNIALPKREKKTVSPAGGGIVKMYNAIGIVPLKRSNEPRFFVKAEMKQVYCCSFLATKTPHCLRHL